MHVRAIMNPISGRRSVAAAVRRLEDALGREGCRLTVTPTAAPGDAARLAGEAPEDTRAVVVVGGDGTLREVVEGLVGRRVPIVVFPSGTENVLAKHFGYRADAAAVVRTLRHGREMAYDVGVCGSRKFILLVGAGIDGEVVRRLAEARKGHISHWTYFGPAWRTWWAHRYPAVTVDVDGAKVYTGRANVWVGTIPRYSGGVRILDRAVVDDGLLDVCILPCASRWRALRCATSLFVRRTLRAAGAQYHQGRQVRVAAIDAAEVSVQVDGDYAGRLPVECSIMEKAVRFLLPPA